MQRVFIAVPVDRRLQKQVNRAAAPVRNTTRDIRWVAEQNRHLTLAFLGDQPDSTVDALAGSMDEAYRRESPFESVFPALTRFPDAKGNIVALVGRENDRLAKLFQRTCGLLAQFGLTPEYETFRPHITVGRVIRPRLLKTRIYQPTNIRLRIDRITLYQSTLTPNGSVYRELKETVLGLTGTVPD